MKAKQQRQTKRTSIRFRESIIPLAIKIVTLELLFTLVAIVISYILTNPQIPSSYEGTLFGLRIGLYGIALVLKILILLSIITKWAGTRYRISKNAIIKQTGLINTKEQSYNCSNIEKVRMNQGLFGKIANYGHISLYSPMLEKEIRIPNIPNPRQLLQQIKTLYMDNSASPKVINIK